MVIKFLIFILCFYSIKINCQIDPRGGLNRNISVKEFWDQAYKFQFETEQTYIKRLTKLIEKRMLLLTAEAKVFINYEQWQKQKCGYYEFCDTKTAVIYGVGRCSEHAIIFENICNEQDINSYILSISIHVLNAVIIKNDTIICDPTFGITFNIKKDSKKLYLKKGLTKSESARYSNLIKNKKFKIFTNSVNSYKSNKCR